MELIEHLVTLLSKGGPWTVMAICMLITRHLYLELRAAHAAFAREKQELNDRIILMTARQVEVLTISNENQKQLIEALKQLED